MSSEEGSVSQLLKQLGLQDFSSRFSGRGYDRVCDILYLENEDLTSLIQDEKLQSCYRAALQKGTWQFCSKN